MNMQKGYKVNDTVLKYNQIVSGSFPGPSQLFSVACKKAKGLEDKSLMWYAPHAIATCIGRQILRSL